MQNLPEDIVTEILSRLPAESIIRCKCVGKAWYVLLTNPNFVSKHVANQHQSNSNNLVFLKQRISYHDELKHQTMCILSNDDINDPEIVNLPSSIQFYGNCLKLIGHCDGLIAFGDNKEGIIVCNFTTREFRALPNSSLGLIPYDDIVTLGDITQCRAYNNMLGFGYDNRINDYKIVRVVSFYWCKRGWSKLMHRVEVFSIRTDSCWRELNVILDSSLSWMGDFDIRGPYFDGSCYWWVKDDETRTKSVLISFHMADEVFVKIPIPTLKCFEDCATLVSVGVYSNSMALFIYPGDDYSRIDIWAMKEFGVEESWSKQLTIKPFIGLYHLGFWNGTDKEFLYVDCDAQPAIYNRVTMESKSLSLRGESRTWEAVPYMKTIVSVKSVEDIASSC